MDMRDDVPDQRGGIQGSLESTQKLLEVLGDNLIGLMEKLDPVMGPDLALDEAKVGYSEGGSDSQVLDTILSINRRIARTTETILGIRERLQL